jgi:Acyl-CoA carboxylase epsilon subunit
VGERDEPFLRVLRGEPTDEELAAVVAVLAGRAAAAPAGPGRPPARSAWAAPTARLRRPLHPGPDAWRRSAR